MRILLVEDNRPLSEWLARTLQKDRYVIECAYDGADAHARLLSERYDLVILDLELPGLAGDEVLRRLRARDNNVPVLILSARDTLAGRVAGLDSGADDYMGKPFEVAELEARIRVLLRRHANHKNPLLRCGALGYDSNTRLFSLGEGPDAAPLQLTPREHALLETLLLKQGQTVSKQALSEALFTLDDNVSPDAVEIYVHRVRKKLLGSDVAIITLRGLGYLLKSQAP
ncbi:response regulator [Curvibacter gracilis]|uniref:response regulator n=1 Tax=Curvibacter gracilis TaxID=230310 RepID=UPI0004877776|nr:response regulator [Curvibacter gracilis]